MSNLDELGQLLTRLELALRPLAAVADAYDDNGLDEVRPERGNKNDAQAVLLSGRGGGILLTLGDALLARSALKALDERSHSCPTCGRRVFEHESMHSHVLDLGDFSTQQAEVARIMKRCPLCTALFDEPYKFCGDCYARADESIERKPEGVSAPEQAVRVALTYLAPLYAGLKPLTVTNESELVSLAVAIGYDLRRARSEIDDLKMRFARPSQADPDLARLVADPKR